MAALVGAVAAVWGGCSPNGCRPARRPVTEAPRAVEGTGGPGRPERVLYDFLANRAAAVVYEGGEGAALVMDAATPDLYKYMDGGFKASLLPGSRDGQELEARPVALADGLAAVLRFPGDGIDLGQGRAELSLWLRPAADVPRQAVSVFLNDKSVANLELGGGAATPGAGAEGARGFGRHRLLIPEGRLSTGENTLRLIFRAAGNIGGHRSAAAIARVAVGPAGHGEAGPEEGSPGRTGKFGIAGDARPALSAARPTRWSYYLVPPLGEAGRGARLTFSYGVQTGGRAAQFTVRSARPGAPARTLWTGRGEPGRWQEAQVDPGFGAQGEALRLDLLIGEGASGASLSGVPPSSALGAVAQPRLVGGAEAQPRSAPPGWALSRAEHLLVFVVDALRADRVLPEALSPAHRPPLNLPGLARLMSGGAVLQASAQGNYPLPAHASILSGTYPAVHRMVRDDAVLAEGVPLMAEALRRAGFATGLFSGSGYVSERWGLRRGFEAYRNLVREGLPSHSGEVWKAARPFLEDKVRAGQRVFLYLAISDPHAPYNPPAELLAKTFGHAYSGPLRPGQSAEQLLLVKRGRLKLSAQDRAYLEALYDAEVLQMDATLASVLADLERLGIADKTAIAFVGSHGEELLDHGSAGHGHSLYDELVTVPLVLRFPPRVAPGVRPDLRVEQCDLAPTLLHLASAAAPEGMQGGSLLPLLGPDARPAMPRAALAQHDQHLRSVHIGRYHLILGGERWQFFDLAADPQERQPHDARDSADYVVALRALRNALAIHSAYQGRWNKDRFGQPADLRPGFLSELGP